MISLIPGWEGWLQQAECFERAVSTGLSPLASCPGIPWGWSWDINMEGGSRLMTLSDDSEERQDAFQKKADVIDTRGNSAVQRAKGTVQKQQ